MKMGPISLVVHPSRREQAKIAPAGSLLHLSAHRLAQPGVVRAFVGDLHAQDRAAPTPRTATETARSPHSAAPVPAPSRCPGCKLTATTQPAIADPSCPARTHRPALGSPPRSAIRPASPPLPLPTAPDGLLPPGRLDTAPPIPSAATTAPAAAPHLACSQVAPFPSSRPRSCFAYNVKQSGKLIINLQTHQRSHRLGGDDVTLANGLLRVPSNALQLRLPSVPWTLYL